jgi:hypothetical protein
LNWYASAAKPDKIKAIRGQAAIDYFKLLLEIDRMEKVKIFVGEQ